MKAKMMGGILMILGTSVGAGMLALPVASAQAGFISATIMLISCWMAMTLGAFLMLEVSLWLPKGSNLISMTRVTLGKSAQWLVWVIYLLLLYSLLCAYIAGNSDLFQSLLHYMHIPIPQWASAIFVVLIFGIVISRGIRSVDLINRSLMSTKLIAYFLLVFFVMPHIQVKNLLGGMSKFHIATIMVMITSFGYAIIVPSLRSYFGDEVTKLRWVIFLGSLLPLAIYILWIAVAQGLLGQSSLFHIAHSGHATSLLLKNINLQVKNIWISKISSLFISICAMTSFLGVSLCLVDFIADGIHVHTKCKKAWLVYALTFLPPLLIIFISPGIFINALAYAGIFCVFILILLPVLMAYSGRYIKNLAHQATYRVVGGKFVLVLGCCFAIALIVWSTGYYER